MRHSLQGEQWFGFQAVRALSADLPEVLLVPLLGHSRGHCGVAIRSDDGWRLHAGDAYFFHAELDSASQKRPFGLDLFQKFMQIDRGARLENQRKLQTLKKSQEGQVRIFCAHDPTELGLLQGAG
jgi:glyoxylase-like metal-dependent hydrolase (beta-lactamase superfamily II)